MICEGSGFPEGDSAMLLISLPADSTTPCLIQIYDFLYNPDSLLSYSIAVEARGSTSSNAPLLRMISAYIGGSNWAAVVRTTKCPSSRPQPASATLL